MTQEKQPSPVGRTRQGEFTLDQIAEMLPGLAMLMPKVGDRYWILYYAAREGNWPLAKHQIHEVEVLLKMGATTRPRMADRLNAFIAEHIAAMGTAIEQKDFAVFERAYRRGTEAANRDHVETNHAEIVWQLPQEPPRQLDLKPQKK